MATPTSGGSITLDDLAALNDEIVALVGAGVPLQRGLELASADLSGRLSRLTAGLAERLGQGQTLADALAAEQAPFPRLYRAIVEAGVRSGRLAAALEGLSSMLRRLIDLRRTTGLALLYPLLIALLGWALFCFLVVVLIPQFVAIDPFGAAVPRWLIQIRATAPVWGPLAPLALVTLLCGWWFLSARSVVFLNRPRSWLWGWIPSAGRIRYWGAASTFADVLALLVEHEVPLADAVRLAAESSGDRRFGRAGEQVAAAIERGDDLGVASRSASDLPPFFSLLSVAADRKDALLRASRQAAANYRRRADWWTDWMRLYLPVLLTAVVGFTVTLGYTLSVFWPWSRVLRDLAMP
ncbi:MAG: type II secretion system F family protein [Pirellulales bacterium]